MRTTKSITKFHKSHSESTKRWLKRQDRDPFVQQAKAEGFRSRAVYKLKEINEKYHLLKPNTTVVDLGAAPGSWTQFCVDNKAIVVAIDRLPMNDIGGATVLCGDLYENDTLDGINIALNNRKPQLVLSDMAPNTTGHRTTDHLQIMGLCDLVLDWSISNLETGGTMVVKAFDGEQINGFLTTTRQAFNKVSRFKPLASRKESSEFYIVAQGFKGNNSTIEV